MTADTIASVSPATVAAPKESAGDIAIRLAQKSGANNATLLKAIWSTRGAIRVQVKGGDDFGGIGIIKSDFTNVLKNLPPADAAKFLLVPFKGGADLVPVEA